MEKWYKIETDSPPDGEFVLFQTKDGETIEGMSAESVGEIWGRSIVTEIAENTYAARTPILKDLVAWKPLC